MTSLGLTFLGRLNHWLHFFPTPPYIYMIAMAQLWMEGITPALTLNLMIERGLAKEMWVENDVPFLNLDLKRPCVCLLTLSYSVITKRKYYPG